LVVVRNPVQDSVEFHREYFNLLYDTIEEILEEDGKVTQTAS